MALLAAVVLVPTRLPPEETPLLVAFLVYAWGPLGMVVLSSALSELLDLPRSWRYVAMAGTYPVGVFLTIIVLTNLQRLSH